MFANPGLSEDTRTPGPNILYWAGSKYSPHPVAGSLPAVNLVRPAERGEPETVDFPARSSPKRQLAELALAELEALAGALLPVLLAFLHARIARQESVFAQARAQLWIE